MNEALENAFATSKIPSLICLEKEFAEKFGMKYAIGGSVTCYFASGRWSLGIKPGDEVVLLLTLASSSFGIVMAGVNPVFADSDREPSDFR